MLWCQTISDASNSLKKRAGPQPQGLILFLDHEYRNKFPILKSVIFAGNVTTLKLTIMGFL